MGQNDVTDEQRTTPVEVDVPGAAPARPLISVVITTRNRSSFVRQAIESVLAQEPGPFDVEITVVDDGSTDDTAEVLREYPIRKVVHSTGLGISGARNLGVRHSIGDFVQILDDDDLLTPSSLASRFAVFEEHPEYGAVHGTAQMTDMELNFLGPPIPTGEKSSGWILEDLLTYFPQIGTVLTRREVLSELGGFLNHLEGEDEWDVFLRTARRFPIGRISTPAMLFRQRVGVPEEEQQWRRTRGDVIAFRMNTQHLPLRRRLALEPVLWRLRGWNCSQFVRYAMMNWHAGDRRRAARSLWYATRWSPIHMPVNVARLARVRE